MNPGFLNQPLDDAVKSATETQQVHILLDNFPSTLAANVLVGLSLVLVAWDKSEPKLLLIWYALIIGSILIRAYLTFRCKLDLTPANARRWARRFTWGALNAGLIWGAGGLLLITEGQVDIAIFIIGGMALGSIGVNASVISVYLSFTTPLLLAPAATFLWLGGTENLSQAVLTIFFLAVMSSVAWRYNRALTQSLVLAYEHRRISEELLMHRDHLQELVEARTAELNAAIQVAEDANEAKSEFLANMTHELRTPMHAILSFAAIGQEQAADASRDKLKEYFSHVRDAGKRLLSLVNGLLDLSKFEARHMRFDTHFCDMGQIIDDLVHEMGGLLEDKSLQLRIDLHTDKPQAYCDRMRMLQVLRNLVSNAIKFSPCNGEIIIRLAPHEVPAGRRQTDTTLVTGLMVSVLDEGIGIPGDELESIFDKFVQSTKTQSGAGGTGLGLAITREIIRAHGGTIEARNRPGGGSEFHFTVPSVPIAGTMATDNRLEFEQTGESGGLQVRPDRQNEA